MIRLRGVTKYYKIGQIRRYVFNDLTVDLPTDRRLAIFGLHESGKSTLMHLLCGLEEPSEGEIERYARLSFPVGYLKALKARFSARQNLQFASRIYGANLHEVTEFIERVTEFGDLLDEPLIRLPVRDRQAFACALSYAIPFDCYLIDGVYAGGTPEFRKKCQAMLEARAQTRGIIFATSHRPVAVRLCDVGAVLIDGKIVMFDTVEEAAKEYERLEGDQAMAREMAGMDDETSEMADEPT